MGRQVKSFNSKTGIETGTVAGTMFDSTSVTVFQKVATGGHSQNICTKVPVAPKGHKWQRGSVFQFIRWSLRGVRYVLCTKLK